ncbi:MAG: hypothetical protein AAB074_17210 [Planctomycetota bacterium]
MTCVEICERLDAFADGEDPAPAEVEAHLRGCPTCEAALAERRAEIASLNAALDPVGQRAEAAAARALAGLRAQRSAGVPWWGLPLAAAAGFLIAVAFYRAREERPVASRLPSVASDAQAAEKRRLEVAAEVDRLLRTPEVGCVVEAVDAKLKKLGAGCVEPAAAWVKKADVEKDVFHRRMAARVVADLAGREQAGLLVEMVGDADAEVRAMAHRGLVRISGAAACSEEQVREDGAKARAAWAKHYDTK